MKKFLGLVLTGILLFCTVFSIVGCGEENDFIEGSFYSLEEAYENGWLTEEDLQSIADIYNGKSRPSKYVAGMLPLETELSIRHTYLEDLKEDVPQATLNDVSLDGYYGTYKSCIVVCLSDIYRHYDLIFKDTYIGDVLFRDYGGIVTIAVWVENK